MLRLLAVLISLALLGAPLWLTQGPVHEQLAVLALTRTDPLPRTRELVAQERYAEAAQYLDYFMAYGYVRGDPAAQHLAREIAARRESLAYQAGKAAEGVWSGQSDEAVGQAAGVISDFLVIGDLRDLARQGWLYAQGEETAPVLIAWATQSGMAQTLAQNTAAMLQACGQPAQAAPLALLDADALRRASRLLVVASTYGDGEPPDEAVAFEKQHMRQHPPLHGLRYAVLALGDSSYDNFCQFGWLASSGGQRLFACIKADSADDFEMNAALAAWRKQLAAAFGLDAAQLARYRAAVQAAHPGQTVRAALLSSDGRMSEIG